jgi:hypothetical protein
LMEAPTDRWHRETKEVIEFYKILVNVSLKDEQLRPHVDKIVELWYCRMIDKYLIYLSEVLTALFTLKPQMLKSNEKVDLEFVLSFSTMEDLLASLIERKVTSLAFEGMRSLARYFENRLKLPLFSDEEELKTAIIAIEIRNLFVHNDGVVNRMFKDRAPSFECTIGQKLRIVQDKLTMRYGAALLSSVPALARRINGKFGQFI